LLASPPVATRYGLARLLLGSAILAHIFCHRAVFSTSRWSLKKRAGPGLIDNSLFYIAMQLQPVGRERKITKLGLALAGALWLSLPLLGASSVMRGQDGPPDGPPPEAGVPGRPRGPGGPPSRSPGGGSRACELSGVQGLSGVAETGANETYCFAANDVSAICVNNGVYSTGTIIVNGASLKATTAEAPV